MDKSINYPFIYIASLMRTGSTVVQEALTERPYSYIFHEPQLCRNQFAIKDKYLKEVKDFNIRKLLRPPTTENFAKNVVPKMKRKIKQIGVKEIENRGWKNYVKYFPDLKIILTGRDPRDIYISVHYWFAKKKTNKWKNGRVLTPKVLFEGLNKDFQMQKEMHKEYGAIKIKYEDLCLHPEETLKIMKEFVNSPIPNVGKIGSFLSNNPKRLWEYELHKEEITNSRVNRWRRETDKQLVKRANKFFGLMNEYREFWNY